jgi:hypothetical protein
MPGCAFWALAICQCLATPEKYTLAFTMAFSVIQVCTSALPAPSSQIYLYGYSHGDQRPPSCPAGWTAGQPGHGWAAHAVGACQDCPARPKERRAPAAPCRGSYGVGVSAGVTRKHLTECGTPHSASDVQKTTLSQDPCRSCWVPWGCCSLIRLSLVPVRLRTGEQGELFHTWLHP